MGQAERSLEHARHALDIDPNFPISLLVQGAAYSLLGQHEEAINCIEKTRSSLPAGYFYVGFLAWAYVRSGRRADAERLRAELEEKRSGRYIPAGTLALIAVALGDTESAFRLAEESIHERDPNISLSIHSAYFHPLRSDPRYLDLLRRMKLPL
jgi:tetratricopeptide (TPR) repeat protein